MAETRDQIQKGEALRGGGAAPAPTTSSASSPPIPPAESDIVKRLAKALAQAAPAEQPGQATSEGIEGGRFIRGARLQNGKLYGGEIVDALGNVLAEFDDKQENTGDPGDGKKPEKSGD